MSRISITVNKKNDEQRESDYLEEIKAELERLKTFSAFWRKKNDNVLFFADCFANTEMFIRLGGVQKALLGSAYFQQVYNDVDGSRDESEESDGEILDRSAALKLVNDIEEE